MAVAVILRTEQVMVLLLVVAAVVKEAVVVVVTQVVLLVTILVAYQTMVFLKVLYLVMKEMEMFCHTQEKDTLKH